MTHSAPPDSHPCLFKKVSWKKTVFSPKDGNWYTKTRELNPKGNPICNAKRQDSYGVYMIRIEDNDQVFINN